MYAIFISRCQNAISLFRWPEASENRAAIYLLLGLSLREKYLGHKYAYGIPLCVTHFFFHGTFETT